MTSRVCRWLRSHLYARPMETESAVELAKEVAISARVVTEQLKPFAEATDPLTALLTDLYRRRAVDDMHGDALRPRLVHRGV